jgi:(1->4)-alpha-D-glucan 1-alpha-D-glucosylmutase
MKREVSPGPEATAHEVSLKRIPLATYRLQFNSQFTFKQAQEIVGYLRDLGVSDAYASPLFQAGPESTHGYDICCFGRVNSNIGTEQEFEAFTDALRNNGMGLLLDMVPNHMGADLSNTWWRDVLEKGPASEYAAYFDIDWQPIKSDLHNKVLLPVLGDHYGKVLAKGEFKLAFEDGKFSISYYDKRFPVAPHCYAPLLSTVRGKLPRAENAFKGIRQLEKLTQAAGAWQATTLLGGKELLQLQEELRSWFESTPAFRAALEAVLADYNGIPGAPAGRESQIALDELLRVQHYRLAYWRVGSEEINYRRFFDVTSLISLRMESPEVFAATHELVFDWLRRGRITGLRIDHPDGLWDPWEYFERLQEKAGPARPLYVVAEKILSGDEALAPDWTVDGTTGYDFLNQLNGLFINEANPSAFDALYRDISGESDDFEDLVYNSKKKILETSLYSEWRALAHRLRRISLASPETQDLTFRQIQAALAVVIAAFPVYRTYAREGRASLSEPEADYVKEAFVKARKREPGLEPAVWTFLENLLLLRGVPGLGKTECPGCLEVAMKFQQLSGPVMAKGLEDTAFYNYNRLISLNEVGGSPEKFGNSPASFHRYNAMRAKLWPHSLSATATHDTKRGEDLRARLNVLSEMPDEWREMVLRWREINAGQKGVVQGHLGPHPNDEYLLYQTLVGAWTKEAETPHGLTSLRDRVVGYMEKALRESKARTSWTDPDAAYETAVKEFVERILDPSRSTEFLTSLKEFSNRISFFGVLNSLAQTLVKLAAPGVPDFYQGTELWDFSLVDPDNRRPVDYRARQDLFSDLRQRLAKTDRAQLAEALLKAHDNGQIKMLFIYLGLECRARNRACLELGDYAPLEVTGPASEHIFAFQRSHKKQTILCVVPRLAFTVSQGHPAVLTRPKVWKDTILHFNTARGNLHNILTSQSFKVDEGRRGLPTAELFRTIPFALLEVI